MIGVKLFSKEKTLMDTELSLQHKPEPMIIQPFSQRQFKRLQEHIHHVRNCFDWPGVPYHDWQEPEEKRFNRWHWHNLPYLKAIHHDPNFIKLASKHFGTNVKPSYVFLSMYGKEGVCPPHTDRPQCQFTIDLVVHQDAPWPIYIEEKPYLIEAPGKAVAYSGTGQAHYRKPMKSDSKATMMNLAFFHFVPANWQGALD